MLRRARRRLRRRRVLVVRGRPRCPTWDVLRGLDGPAASGGRPAAVGVEGDEVVLLLRAGFDRPSATVVVHATAEAWTSRP